ncbi:MAG: phasin family protein [Burkholderiales bacterium]
MSTMNVTPEQVRAASKANLEGIIEIATTQFAAAEKIGNLQAIAVKSAFEDTIANVRALAAANDVQEYVKLQASFAQPAVEKAVAYSKGVYEVVTQASADYTKVAERRIAEWNEGVLSFLDKALKNIPGASDTVVTVLKQAIAASNSAYENLTRATKQATEIAEANVAAATETVKGMVAKTRKAA